MKPHRKLQIGWSGVWKSEDKLIDNMFLHGAFTV